MSQPTHPTSIDRDYIRLLQAMRRFVREEFSISIRMTQEDAIEQLLHYAGQSRNHVLQEMAQELQGYAGITPGEAAAKEASTSDSEEKVRYYRGVAIAVEEADEKDEAEKSASSGPKKIYRGRVID